MPPAKVIGGGDTATACKKYGTEDKAALGEEPHVTTRGTMGSNNGVTSRVVVILRLAYVELHFHMYFPLDLQVVSVVKGPLHTDVNPRVPSTVL